MQTRYNNNNIFIIIIWLAKRILTFSIHRSHNNKYNGILKFTRQSFG